jgi:hypothetical protein
MGRLSRSFATDPIRVSSGTFLSILLNSSAEFVRTIGLLDFPPLIARAETLWNISGAIGCEYASINAAIAVERLVI